VLYKDEFGDADQATVSAWLTSNATRGAVQGDLAQMIMFWSRVASTRRRRLGVSRQQRRKGDRLPGTLTTVITGVVQGSLP
jgi:hypothetical protein